MLESEMATGEGNSKDGKLKYTLAVEATELNAFHRAFLSLKRFLSPVHGALGDVAVVGTRILTNVGMLGILLRNEVKGLFQEMKDLPWTTRQMWINKDFLRPLQSFKEFIWISRCLREDFLCNWSATMRRSSVAYNSKWSRASKVYIGSVLFLSVFTLYHYKIRAWPSHNKKTEINCLHKTVVITGSSSGIGYRLAYEFASRGAFVILTSPDMVKARKARVDLGRKLSMLVKNERKIFLDNAQVRYWNQLEIPYQLDLTFILQNIVEVELDLASTSSVYSFTRKLQGLSPDGIDILINNAAVICPPEEMVVTEEGKEVHFAVNYFGHFILTHLVLGMLAKRKGARIINLTCRKGAQSVFLNLEEFIGPYLQEDGLPFLPAEEGYASSKLAMYFFNRQLSKELSLSEIDNVTTYCVCPGETRTFLDRHLRFPFFYRWLRSIAWIFLKKDWHAVQCILHCALSPKCASESGFFYENNKRAQIDTLHPNQDELAQALWTSSMALMTIGHQPMLKLTEQMHITSDENIFQLAQHYFLHRRDVMTHLLLMEERQSFKRRNKKYVDDRGDARDDFNYFWHGFYLSGGENSSLLERWVLHNAHPGFRELQKEYDIWFECTGAKHYYPKNNGKMAGLQYMTSMPAPLEQADIEELEELYESDSEPDEEMEGRHLDSDYIRMEEFLDEDY